METPEGSWKKIVFFLSLTAITSLVFAYPLIVRHKTDLLSALLIGAIMWCPGIAALLTRFRYQGNQHGMGWNLGPRKYLIVSFALPLFYTAATYTIIWVSGMGHFPNAAFLTEIARQFGLSAFPLWTVATLFITAVLIVGTPISIVAALGEEIGWRGFLVPELAKRCNFLGTSLISGSLWAVWHYPLILWGENPEGTPVWYRLLCFTVMVMALSIAFTWLRLRSGSLWTGVLLHAGDNLFILAIFTPLTADTGITRYIAGEFGAGLAVASLIVAAVFWRLRAAIEPKRDF
jgi:membrane protease YdiL (CAAX protease family)